VRKQRRLCSCDIEVVWFDRNRREAHPHR
jgi:hypothetical protein